MSMPLFSEGGVCAAQALRPALLLLIAVAFTAACSTPSSNVPAAGQAATVASESAADSSNPLRVLRKGLSGDEVKSLLGSPKKIEPYVAAGLTNEIWFYERLVPGPTRQVPTGMREVPFVDPISGVMRMLQEPTYQNEVTSIVETTQLLMIAGALAEWKQSRLALRDFN
jgi:hypothetical protein